ncbi:MAG: hypothetical protein IRY86_11005, partial [Thermorudis peleae]|nr:hypothetical protein [Thermorudis peleae]
AIMVLNVDDPIPEEALEEIRQIPDIATAYVVSLPQPQPLVTTRSVRVLTSSADD